MVAQSPEPGAHVLNARAFRIELEFRNVGFCGEGKTGVPGEKPLGAEKRTNNKLNPHMTSSPGIEPGSHWWKASALTTAPSLLPKILSGNNMDKERSFGLHCGCDSSRKYGVFTRSSSANWCVQCRDWLLCPFVCILTFTQRSKLSATILK